MNISDAVRTVERDLRDIFGQRLQSLVAYATNGGGSGNASTLAVVDNLTPEDLRRCAARASQWHDAGAATPLILEAREFGRSLDSFPFEFGAILADHVLISGANPFDGLRVEPDDLRRACEVQARSHLLHLREGFIETGGRGDLVAELIVRSAAPLSALLRHVRRLAEAVSEAEDASLVRVTELGARFSLSSDEARQLFPAYLDAVERLTNRIDRWKA
jgi:hypothetical protein